VSLTLLLASAWLPLHSDTATASSFLQNNWNKYQENYHAFYALDGVPATAWVEGKEGDGVGETLHFDVSKVTNAKRARLTIHAGYHKSKALWDANGRPSKVRVRLLTAAGGAVVAKEFDLKDEMKAQELVLDLPQAKSFEAVELTILAVTKGTKYADTCISDVQFALEDYERYNASAEKAKLARLTAWTKERKSQAAYFANLPAPYPFAATQYTGDTPKPNDGAGPPDLAADLQAARARMAALAKVATWYTGTVKGKVLAPDLPGDVDLFSHVLPYLRGTEVSWFEAKDAVGAKATPKNDYMQSQVRTNFKIGRMSDGKKIKDVYFKVTSVYEERRVYTEVREMLLVYDGNDMVQSFYVSRPSDADEDEPGYEFTARVLLEPVAGDKIGKIGVDMVASSYDFDMKGNPVLTETTHRKAAYFPAAQVAKK